MRWRVRTGLWFAAAAACVLIVALAACTPESESKLDKHGYSDEPVVSETEWGAETEGGGYQPTPTLPASFPGDRFVLPDSAVIFDAGERDGGGWFVVLTAGDETAAEELWAAVIGLGSFEVHDEQTTAEGGRYAELRSEQLGVQALTISQPDGSVQLSYELRRAE